MKKQQPAPIVKTVQPARLRWLMHQVKAAGIPFTVDRAGGQYKVITTDQRALTVFEQVYGYRATGKRRTRQRRQEEGIVSMLAKWFKQRRHDSG